MRFQAVGCGAARAVGHADRPAQAQRPVWEQTGTLNCDVSAGIGFIVGSQRAGELPVHAELSGPARAVCRDHHQGRPRHRRDRRRPAGLGGAHVDDAPARRARRLLCGRVRRGDALGRGARRQSCWSAATTARSRCSRSRCRARSASTSRPASPRSRCNSCADAIRLPFEVVDVGSRAAASACRACAIFAASSFPRVLLPVASPS